MKVKTQKKISAKVIVTRIFTILLLTVLLAYLIFNSIKLFTSPTDIFVVEEGVLDSEETVDAYVIRNEIVLQGNNYKNGMERIIVEGNRVGKSEPVFRYYVNGEDTIKSEIDELDKEIAEVQKSEKINYTTDIEVLKGKIKELEEKIYNTNNIEEINKYKKEIDDYTYKISTIVGESSPKGSYLKELIDKKTECMNKLTSGAEEIKATESGTVSYRVDNLEEVFTTKDFNYLTEDFLNSLELKTGELIETSNEKGKVITEFNCYLAVVMNSEAAKNAKVDDNVIIKLDSENKLNAKIMHINECNGSRVLIFKIDDLPEKLLNYRKLSVNVIWWEKTGLKVPVSALKEQEGKYYLERNRAGYNVDVLVKVLKQNESYAIVTNYTTNELQEMGYSYKQIKDMYTIKQYDKIKISK